MVHNTLEYNQCPMELGYISKVKMWSIYFTQKNAL